MLSAQETNLVLKYIDGSAGEVILGVILDKRAINEEASHEDVFNGDSYLKKLKSNLTGLIIDNLEQKREAIEKLFTDYIDSINKGLKTINQNITLDNLVNLIDMIVNNTSQQYGKLETIELLSAIKNFVILDPNLEKRLDKLSKETFEAIFAVHTFLHIPEAISREETLKEVTQKYERKARMLRSGIDDEINKLKIKKIEDKEKNDARELGEIERVRHAFKEKNQEQKPNFANNSNITGFFSGSEVKERVKELKKMDPEVKIEQQKKEPIIKDPAPVDHKNEITKSEDLLGCFISYDRYSMTLPPGLRKFATRLNKYLESTNKVKILSSDTGIAGSNSERLLDQNINAMKKAKYIILIVSKDDRGLEYSFVMSRLNQSTVLPILYDVDSKESTILGSKALRRDKNLGPALLKEMGITEIPKVFKKKVESISLSSFFTNLNEKAKNSGLTKPMHFFIFYDINEMNLNLQVFVNCLKKDLEDFNKGQNVTIVNDDIYNYFEGINERKYLFFIATKKSTALLKDPNSDFLTQYNKVNCIALYQNNTTVLPILFDGNIQECLPFGMQSYISLAFTDVNPNKELKNTGCSLRLGKYVKLLPVVLDEISSNHESSQKLQKI